MAQDLSRASTSRLAIVTGGMDLGGTTTFMCNLAGELIRRQIPVAIFSLSRDHPLAADFVRQQIPVFLADERRQIFEDRLTSVLERVRDFSPTAVIANLSPSSFEALRYVPAGVTRIGTVQSHDPGWYAMLRAYHAVIDLVAGVSPEIQAQVRRFPEFERTPVACLPYGVPMPAITTKTMPTPDQPLRILYLGRLQQVQKRVRLFPTILARLRAAGIPFHWTIAGAGPEQPWLEAEMKSSSPRQTITFAGQVAYADVPALLAAHDIFLLASDYEGLPLSLLEAMGAGLVPVVSDLASGIRTVVSEDAGLRVPVAQPEAYAEAIVRLHQQRDEFAAFSRHAAAKVRREYSVATMADRWLAALPAPGTPVIGWPRRFSILPILANPQSWRFSRLGRGIRRSLLRLGWRR